jgi:RHS repeat-associated protein
MAGNLTSDGGNSYLYDGERRICAVASTPIAGMTAMTGYIYDAGGTRVAKGTITAWRCDPGANGFQTLNDYILGPGGEQVTEMGMGANGAMAWQRTNVYGGGKQLATYDMAPDPAYTANSGLPAQLPALHFQLTDPLGTRRMQTSAVGRPETGFQSLPFGDQPSSFSDPYAPATADDATPLHFTGKERDAESGNDYFFARYYSSAMGRFLSPDWSAKEEPVPYAKMDDPQTLNLYGYLRNNPLGGVDADGHCGGGPNDPPCSEVKVQAKVTQQPKMESNTPVKDSNGKVIAHGTGPTGGQIKDTVTVNGKPVEGVGVAEKNVLKNTENGAAIPGTLNENRSAVPTDSNGQIKDDVTMQQKAGSAEVNKSIVFDMSTNVYTSTDKQTLTLTFPSGGTCTATCTRVMTNAGPNGQPSATYTLKTTQPVVHDPSN